MKNPRVEIICIGSELLTDQVNTHGVYLGKKLSDLGLSVSREHTVGDDKKLMSEVFKESFNRSDVIITSGGLGPTFDDLTRDMWSKVTGRSLKLNKVLLHGIQQKFRSRNIDMPPHNRRQAYVLKGAEPLPNRNGTAPGQFLRVGKKSLVLLPGPKRELIPMMEEEVLPRLRKTLPKKFVALKNFYLVGIPESKIDDMIRPVVKKYQKLNKAKVVFGILAARAVIHVKYRIEGETAEVVQKANRKLEPILRKKIKPYLFSETEDQLQKVIAQTLRTKGKTLAVAESCTGGLLAKYLTDVPGSSAFFIEGAVTYTNSSKAARLGVIRSSLQRYGAVSSRVAFEMAKNFRKRARVDYALSITGIAGPTGGTSTKPVGLVFIGCASSRRTFVKKFTFSGNREWIRHRSAMMALDILRREVS